MVLTRLAGLTLIVAGIGAQAQVFEGLDLTPKKPKKTWVSVKLTEPVTGAQLFIDGEAAGELPVVEKVVKAGEHTLKIERPGFATLEEKVTVVAGKKNELSYTLVATGGVITIEGTNDEVSCSIDGAAPEPLPLTKVLLPGPHVLLVRAGGFKDEQRTIEVKAGVDAKEAFTLVASADRPTAVSLEPEPDNDLEAELGTKKTAASSPSLFSRWYVWAGIGAVVAAGVVTAVAVTQAPRPTVDPSVVCGGMCDATIGWPPR
ncbi:MAG: PEGA domain-containing protein [Myxococcaceae bacterium]|nr:PEGA domain-containing protein [Myxococcaceae bacterium]